MPTSTKKIRLCISYDGTDFCGWQRQKEHASASLKPSIQQTLEEALGKVFNQRIEVNASGRTDAGVHALAQVCDFDVKIKNGPRDLCWAVKPYLPPSISLKQAWSAPPEFHSTLSATAKTYRYWIWSSPRSSALLHRYSWWVRRPLDIKHLQALTDPLVGEHDFKSFQSVGTPVAHTVRRIDRALWRHKSPHLLEFQITGSGFLKQMVRNIVGTLHDFERAQGRPEQMQELLAARDRRLAGVTAPPQGLFLQKVFYPGALDNKCLKL